MLNSDQDGPHAVDACVGIEHRERGAFVKSSDRRLHPVFGRLGCAEYVADVLQDFLYPR